MSQIANRLSNDFIPITLDMYMHKNYSIDFIYILNGKLLKLNYFIKSLVSGAVPIPLAATPPTQC